jgi:hypothetical protein
VRRIGVSDINEDFDVVEEAEVQVLHEAVECMTCLRINIVEAAGGQVRCGYCGGYTKVITNIERHTCLEPRCTQFLSSSPTFDLKLLCQGRIGANGRTCGQRGDELTTVLVTELPLLPPIEVESGEPAAVRRLRAAMHNAEAFVASSGTHHRSTSGKHGSQSAEKHSAAMAGKASVRRLYTARIEEQRDAVQALDSGNEYAALITEANSVIQKVQNK